ncbi:MAG: elongation factor P [candidate division WOR-3 bacterium]
MVIAAELKTGMTIKLEKELYKVITAEFKAGTAKLGSLVNTKLRNIKTHTITERRFHPEERLEDVMLETQTMEFIYRDGTDFCFMHPESFEQVMVDWKKIGDFEKFLTTGTRLRIQFYEGVPIDVIIPETVEIKVASTGEGIKGEVDAAYKSAILENGMEIQVPQFIKSGDVIKVEVATRRYLERVKG